MISNMSIVNICCQYWQYR